MADWTHVQGTNTTAGSGTSNSLSFAVGNGNVVRGGVLLSHGSQVTKVTDDRNNVYRVTTDGDDGSGLYAALFRSVGLITNAPTTISVTCAPSSATFWIALDEFSPPTGTTAICLDGSQQLLSSTAASTANFQTLNPDDLVYAISFSTGVSTTGAGFTAGQGSGTGICSEWKIQAAASGSVNATYATQTLTTWMLVDAISPVAQTRWEFNQRANQRTATSATSGSVSFPNAVPAGHIIIADIAVDSLANLTSLTDDKGKNYQPNILTPNSGGRAIFWSGGLVNNGPKTITAQVSPASATVFFMAVDFAPPPGTTSVAIDGGGLVTTTTDTGATTTTPNITTTHNGDLAYSMCESTSAGAAPANSFSVLSGYGSTWADGYFIQQTSGSINASWTHSDPTGLNQSLVTFSAVSGGAGGTSFGLALGLGLGSLVTP